MSEADYYPAGAYNDPNAPYNQPPEPDEKEFDVTVTYTMTKADILATCDYTTEMVEDCDIDDDGKPYSHRYSVEHTDNVDWNEEFSQQRISPIQLFNELKVYVVNEIRLNKEFLSQAIYADEKRKLKKEIKRLELILKSCEGWEFEDIDFDEE